MSILLKSVAPPTSEAAAAPETQIASQSEQPRSGLSLTALAAPLRHWKVALAVILVSGALAWVVGLSFRQVLWRTQGVLIYAPLPLPASQKGAYSPPSPQTLIALVKSPKNLETLRSELGLAVPARVLDEQIRVNQPRNADLIEVSLDWAEPEMGATIVNRLMELHVRGVAALRKSQLGDTIISLEREQKATEDRLVSAREEYDGLLSATTSHDLAAEVDRKERECEGLEQAIGTARQTQERYAAQIQRLETFIHDPKPPSASEKGLEVPAGVLDAQYLSIERSILDALHTEKGKLAETEKKLQLKERELKDDLGRVDRGIVSKSEVEKLRDEIAILVLQNENGTKAVAHCNQQLQSLARQHAAGKKTAFTDEIEAGRLKISQMEKTLEGVRKQSKDLVALLRKADILTKRIKEIDEERIQLRDQSAALRHLRDTDVNEFTVAAPALAASSPVSSSRMKVTLATFALPMFLFFGLVVGREQWDRWRTGASWARRAGLKVLAGPSAGTGNLRLAGAAERDLASRRMALGLARQLAEAEAVVLFVAPDGGPDPTGLIVHISQYLGMTGERVLILDARTESEPVHSPECESVRALVDLRHNSRPASHFSDPRGETELPSSGLAGYLALKEDDVLALLRATKMTGVDYLSVGGSLALPSPVPARPLGEAFRRLTEIYKRILIIGPTLSQALETELLAGYADAVLITLAGAGRPVSGEAESLIRYLRETNVPVLGAVILP
jgi:hypothetical protein